MTRRGFTLIELVAATVMLGVLITVSVRMLAATAAADRAAWQRQAAWQEAANLMERIDAMPWEQIDPAHVDQLQLPERLRQSLPDGNLQVQLETPPEEPEVKQITVTISWGGTDTTPSKKARLSMWKYKGSLRPESSSERPSIN